MKVTLTQREHPARMIVVRASPEVAARRRQRLHQTEHIALSKAGAETRIAAAWTLSDGCDGNT